MINYKVRVFDESQVVKVIEHQSEVKPQVGDHFAIEVEDMVYEVFIVKRVVFPILKAYEHAPFMNEFYIDIEKDYYV